MRNLIIIILTIISNPSFSQQGELVFNFNGFKVFKEVNKNTYSIFNKENKLVFQNLKYVNYAGHSNSLQVLDTNNNLLYFDDSLNKIKTPKEGIIQVCGTVAYFKRKIIDNEENYLIEFTEDKSVYGEGIKKSIVDTIPKKNIKEIYFANLKQEIDYDENFDFPTYLILDLGDTFGIKQGELTEYFDHLDLKNPFAIKVSIKDAFGYYGITKVNYKTLGDFEYNLASFTDKKGNTGYIDMKGNRY